jgi:hypothetical protein
MAVVFFKLKALVPKSSRLVQIFHWCVGRKVTDYVFDRFSEFGIG